MITSQILKFLDPPKRNKSLKYLEWNITQLKFTSSESTVEILEKGVKYVQS